MSSAQLTGEDLDNRHARECLNEYVDSHIGSINEAIRIANESGANFVNYDLPNTFADLKINMCRAHIQTIVYYLIIKEFKDRKFRAIIKNKKQKNGNKSQILHISWKPLYELEEIEEMKQFVIENTEADI